MVLIGPIKLYTYLSTYLSIYLSVYPSPVLLRFNSRLSVCSKIIVGVYLIILLMTFFEQRGEGGKLAGSLIKTNAKYVSGILEFIWTPPQESAAPPWGGPP